MTDFDVYAESYRETGQRALTLSGETQEHFARGRIGFLKTCLAAMPGPSNSVLDFGCGVGSSISLLREAFGAERVVGVDASAQSLKIARHRHPTAQFFLPDEFDVHEQIDLAFCNGVFHHIAPRQRPAVMDSIARALRPGARFALWENNPWNPGMKYSMAQCAFDRDAIAVSAPSAVRLVRAAGLRILSVRFMFIFPRMLRVFRWSEPHLARLPIGAQYQVLSEKLPSP
jgi:SAM-dependent methyltransferase